MNELAGKRPVLPDKRTEFEKRFEHLNVDGRNPNTEQLHVLAQESKFEVSSTERKTLNELQARHDKLTAELQKLTDGGLIQNLKRKLRIDVPKRLAAGEDVELMSSLEHEKGTVEARCTQIREAIRLVRLEANPIVLKVLNRLQESLENLTADMDARERKVASFYKVPFAPSCQLLACFTGATRLLNQHKRVLELTGGGGGSPRNHLFGL